ncbi:dihydrolipoamide acetyltransferase family protein [Cellulomonas xylanilytica]|uniref:Dihydrolipoamide acetyltransferase component of pyruvate dehydrogenase complex n=1 Tax=Cellulomonas xylanilytica TaxID=233583 RepID=A0A510VDS6_9CELL|nr:dihydrolipoamide acetyltransferase family protein [Cellulomonas xylanilytica]GEK23285.1 dihydrolipoamide acetyltransferase component of pyruvate dehydrogenase complex [Cellulomonas xylanilytica]
MTTIRTVTLPDLGEGLTESDLVEWVVAVGDTVELNQVVAEVETAKALVQLPSPYAGVVAELLVEPGVTVPVGTALLTIAVEEPATADGAAVPPAVPAPAATDAEDAVPEAEGVAPAASAAPERTAVLVGYGPLVEGSARPRRRSKSEEWAAAHAVADDVGLALAGGRIGPRVLPPVRKLAHDLGVDLNKMVGSGKDGMITREDVLRAVSGVDVSPSARRPDALSAAHRPGLARPRTDVPAPARPETAAREHRTPVAGVRKQTAAAMVASAFTAPHASTSLTVDVTPTLELLEAFRADRALQGHRISILTLVAKAVTIAVGGNPSVNAHWDEAAGEIVQFGYVNLGIAAATPRGLLVPSIKDADRLRLPDLADAIGHLTEDARAGTTSPADLAGGTITITNIGVFGVDTGTPILVPGQAAILAMGAIRRRPWEFQGEIALRSVMTLSVSFDHRLVDGAEAARFLSDVGTILARPGMVLGMV